MRNFGAAALLSAAASLLQAHAEATPNLAYTEDFVWYLSARLASELTDLNARSGASIPEDLIRDFGRDYEFIYFRLLIDCEGPLSKLAEAFKFYSLDSSSQPVRPLAYVGSMESEIKSALNMWNLQNVLRVLEIHRTGQWISMPGCIDKRFLAQNPSYSVLSR
jgi:hypothetical protein